MAAFAVSGQDAVLAVARRIVEQEVGGSPTTEGVAAAAEQICARLYREIGRWVGLDGCDALVARALDEVRHGRPWLASVRSRPRHVPHLDGLEAGLHGQESTGAVDALVMLVATFIELLGVAIGLELAQRLVQNAWRDELAWANDPEKRRHEW